MGESAPATSRSPCLPRVPTDLRPPHSCATSAMDFPTARLERISIYMSTRTVIRQRERARHLRRNMTPAENCLWSRLRRRAVSGYKFRRQTPIGPYIVDFVCLQKGLIIEVDGEHHCEGRRYDERRTLWLHLRGFQTLRFWNYEVIERMDAVRERIRAELRT